MRLLSILIALILSQGWQWARLGQEQGFLPGELPFYVAIAMMLLFLLQQWALTIKLPTKRAVALERAPVVNRLLEELLAKYYSVLTRVGGTDTPQPLVRCNVMLPVHKWLGCKKYLQIFYKGCLLGTDYTPAEMDLKWGKKNGAVGWVWSRGQEQLYSVSRGTNPVETLDASHKKAVAQLKSLYAAPILRNGSVLGVLTIDGQMDLDRTRFNDNEIRSLVDSYAVALSSQCFESGVAAR